MRLFAVGLYIGSVLAYCCPAHAAFEAVRLPPPRVHVSTSRAAAANAAPPLLWQAPEAYRGRTVTHPRRGFPSKLVALTFDDGPTRQITPQILAILKKHSIHATFFILGQQARMYPRLVRQIYADGHAIGFHTYTHGRRPSQARAENEMSRCEAILRKTIGARTALFRPPYGLLRTNYVRTALKRGYTVITWTNDDSDTRTKSPVKIERSVLSNLKSGDIVLMHDNATKKQTIAALPTVVDAMTRAGYRFLTVPEMLAAWNERDRQVAAHAAHAPRHAAPPHAAHTTVASPRAMHAAAAVRSAVAALRRAQ